jgi:cytochrome c oxidase cbb3-type subunit 4
MDLAVIYETARSMWTVWFFLLFSGLVAWALWPSRKAEHDRNARIPLED